MAWLGITILTIIALVVGYSLTLVLNSVSTHKKRASVAQQLVISGEQGPPIIFNSSRDCFEITDPDLAQLVLTGPSRNDRLNVTIPTSSNIIPALQADLASEQDTVDDVSTRTPTELTHALEFKGRVDSFSDVFGFLGSQALSLQGTQQMKLHATLASGVSRFVGSDQAVATWYSLYSSGSLRGTREIMSSGLSWFGTHVASQTDTILERLINPRINSSHINPKHVSTPSAPNVSQCSCPAVDIVAKLTSTLPLSVVAVILGIHTYGNVADDEETYGSRVSLPPSTTDDRSQEDAKGRGSSTGLPPHPASLHFPTFHAPSLLRFLKACADDVEGVFGGREPISARLLRARHAIQRFAWLISLVIAGSLGECVCSIFSAVSAIPSISTLSPSALSSLPPPLSSSTSPDSCSSSPSTIPSPSLPSRHRDTLATLCSMVIIPSASPSIPSSSTSCAVTSSTSPSTIAHSSCFCRSSFAHAGIHLVPVTPSISSGTATSDSLDDEKTSPPGIIFRLWKDAQRNMEHSESGMDADGGIVHPMVSLLSNCLFMVVAGYETTTTLLSEAFAFIGGINTLKLGQPIDASQRESLGVSSTCTLLNTSNPMLCSSPRCACSVYSLLHHWLTTAQQGIKTLPSTSSSSTSSALSPGSPSSSEFAHLLAFVRTIASKVAPVKRIYRRVEGDQAVKFTWKRRLEMPCEYIWTSQWIGEGKHPTPENSTLDGSAQNSRDSTAGLTEGSIVLYPGNWLHIIVKDANATLRQREGQMRSQLNFSVKPSSRHPSPIPPTQYPSLSFGRGPHACLGERLAVIESAIILARVLSRVTPYLTVFPCPSDYKDTDSIVTLTKLLVTLCNCHHTSSSP